MNSHIFLPGVALSADPIHPAHEKYLREWREEAIRRADGGDVAASVCHQGTLIDLAIDGNPTHDWLGVMDEFLGGKEKPLAYSKVFGQRLYGFNDQVTQTTLHSIHTRWWIESVAEGKPTDPGHLTELVLAKRQSDGLIYDRDVSPTILRHRMRSELTMSMAMAGEILGAAGAMNDTLAAELATDLSNPSKCPPLGYMSMEYFRLTALRYLKHEDLFPVGLSEHLSACAEGLPVGWCDFAMTSKVDAYMGTAKRTARDKPIHSPLIACHVAVLIEKVDNDGDIAESWG